MCLLFFSFEHWALTMMNCPFLGGKFSFLKKLKEVRNKLKRKLQDLPFRLVFLLVNVDQPISWIFFNYWVTTHSWARIFY